MEVVVKIVLAARYFCNDMPVHRVGVNSSYRSFKTVGYRSGRFTELTELSGVDLGSSQNSQNQSCTEPPRANVFDVQ